MQARRARSYWNAGIGPLTLASCLALAGGIACNGSVGEDPPRDEPSTNDVPKTPAANGGSPTPTPGPKPIAPQPVGPYTGVVGTTDVSILYPMPVLGQST